MSLRILILAPDSNPDSVTGPLIGFRHAEALARLHKVTLVIRARNEKPVRRDGSQFHAIEAIRLPLLDPFYAWAIKRIFNNDYSNLLLTPFRYPLAVAFECRAWKLLRSRILSSEFDVVLRLLPVVPMLPSPFAYFLRRSPIPFVIGPLNGGLPWPKGFSQLENQKATAGFQIASLRGLYRYMPFAHSTFARAAAIIAGSSQTYKEFSGYREKLFFVPGENGLQNSLLDVSRPASTKSDRRLRLVYVGRLVPYKAADLAIRAAAPLLRAGAAQFDILGDGQDRQRLEDLSRSLGLGGAVTFCGMLPHSETLRKLREADVMVFPSLREFGGGVVFEALGLGAVPVVADYGGPGDIVTSEVGYKVPLVNEEYMVSHLNTALARLSSDREHLEDLRSKGMLYARQHLTWDAKARMVTEILNWVTGRGPKPRLSPPQSNQEHQRVQAPAS